MNVNLRYEVDFAAAIYYPVESQTHSLQLNWYSVHLRMTTATENSDEMNLAMDRLRAWIYEELSNTIFIEQSRSEEAMSMTKLGFNVTTLPEEPLDQIIGMMLYCKLNAIMCGRMTVDELEISSKLGDQVWYLHTAGDPLGPFAALGWWHQPSLQHHDLDPKPRASKMTKIHNVGWKKYNLEWPSGKEQVATATVVFADFKHDEN